MIWQNIWSLYIKDYNKINKTYTCICSCWNIYNAKKSFLADWKKIHECWLCRAKRENKSFLWVHWDWEIISEAKYIKTKRVVDAKCLLCWNIYKDIWLYWILERKSWCISCNTSKKNKEISKDYSKYIWAILWWIEILWYDHNNRTFDCKCACWNMFTDKVYDIIRWHKNSCWCLKNKESWHANKIQDLIWLNIWLLTLVWEDTEYNINRNKSKQVKKYIFECWCWRWRTISASLFDFKNWLINSCWCLKSKQQLEFWEFLNSVWIMFSENNRSLWFEIDFLLEKNNLWIEYNWVRWHSITTDMEKEDRKKWKRWYTKQKQYIKKQKAYMKWINLLHIREDEWLNKRPIIESMIKNKVWLSKKIYARKCKIIDIGQHDFNNFCNNNHIQWKTSSTKYRYWLEYDWKIVSVMWFDWKHELNRFCSLLWYNVIWWFNKLLNYHIKKENPKKIISFAALDIVDIDNNIYSKSWFIMEWKPDISYFYVKNEKKIWNRLHKATFRKSRITKKFWYKFKEWETEYEAMEKLWYYRCYNSWIQKYVLTL